MSDTTSMYEFSYILNGTLNDDKTKDLVARVSKFVTENGGNILEQDEPGNRRLSYPINKKNSGYYVNLYFTAPPNMIAKLERAATINDDIIRFMTLAYDAKMKRHYEKRTMEADVDLDVSDVPTADTIDAG